MQTISSRRLMRTRSLLRLGTARVAPTGIARVALTGTARVALTGIARVALTGATRVAPIGAVDASLEQLVRWHWLRRWCWHCWQHCISGAIPQLRLLHCPLTSPGMAMCSITLRQGLMRKANAIALTPIMTWRQDACTWKR